MKNKILTYRRNVLSLKGTWLRMLLAVLAAQCSLLTATAQTLNDRYNSSRPVVMACDWDKPPYEYLNDKGEPAGTNIDVMRAIMKEMNLPIRFVMKDWGNAIKTFERGDADIIMAHTQRFRHAPYYVSRNIINYNRIVVAMKGDSATRVTLKMLDAEGAVFKPSDYAVKYYISNDSSRAVKVDYQSPKTALMGLVVGDNKYFVWGEAPLKWKIKELNIEGLVLSSIDIPVSEIHVIGRDKVLIDEIDDHYSRLKQSGVVEEIHNRWVHPERVEDSSLPWIIGLVVLALLVVAVFYTLSVLARRQVRNNMKNLTDVNNMMIKALHMGNFYVMEYDIEADLQVNRYGHLLPDGGITHEQFLERIHPDERGDFNKKVRLMIERRSRHELLRKHWNAGTAEAPRWLTLDGHAMVETDSFGKPRYLINAVHDITKGLVEEHTSFELSRKFDQLFSIPTLAMAFYDKDGRLIGLNDYMCEICGFSSADNKHFWESSRLFDLPQVIGAYGPADRHDLHACQHMLYPEQGIDCYVEFHVCPIFNAEGEVANYFASCIDVTNDRESDRSMHRLDQEIQATSKQIRQLEEKLHYMLVSTNMYVWQLDFQRRLITYTSTLSKPEYVCTFDEYNASICNDSGDALIRGQNPEKLREPFVLQRRFARPMVHNTDAEGERWYQVMGVGVTDDNNQVTGAFGLFRDITNLIHTQQRLREETARAEDSGRQKSMFLASMTHELRTPLNSIVGFSDLLGSADSPEERHEFIRIIRNNCDMLLRLINDILEASTIDDGPQSVNPTDVDFAKAFDDICQSLEHRVQTPGVSFIKENPYTTLPARIDIDRIRQVVTNFVTNSVKYTKEGHIKVGYRQKDGGLYIYCEDTGLGIPKEKQASVFERFVKLNEFVQGTGLGLSICKSIAERCGGRIGVDSEGEGHGSTFWIWVPVG